jgi:integrase
MPNRAKGTRLYLRERAGRPPVWVIRDSGQPERSTGTADRREAEAQLAAYIAERDRRAGPQTADRLTVAEALAIYGEDRGTVVADPARIGYAIAALLPFWGHLPVSAVSGATCRRYAATRPAAASTVRRELGALQAALRHCLREGYLLTAPPVSLPPKSAPRDRWLTVPEAAALLRAARATPHLARFILLALYTGTRRDAILSLGWAPHPGGGWLDLDAGVMHRRSPAERETAKRRPPARMPAKLLAHCRRWRRDGALWVIHHHGARPASIKTSWATAIRRAGLTGVTPHVLRHTAITWAMQRGTSIEEASAFFGVTTEELQRTYWHHHPDFGAGAAAAMNRGGR